MNTKQTEALKLAQDLRALADRFSEGWHEGIKIDALDIELLANAAEALAEQPAQQKEPFGYFRYDLRLDAWVQNREGRPGTAFYTSPQAQRTWVGLTDDERLEVAEIDGADEWFWKVCKAIEAKLREKNA